VATWPTYLPAAWLDGAPLNVQPGVVRSEMLSGHVRQRMVMTLPFDTYSATFSFSNLEFRAFEFFIRDMVGQSEWFIGPYHDGSGQQSGTIRLVGGGYSATQNSDTGYWSVTAEIEIDGRK